MSAYDDLAARWDAVMMPNYGTPPLALARGEGARVWDVDGRSYLDLVAGIAVSALGHGHPAVVEAVSQQVATLAHTSNLYMHAPGVRLAERLVALVGGDARVFLCNSGAEANEAALKLVRRHAGQSRPHVVSTEHSFHGRTSGALAVTGKAAIREPFGPFGYDVTFVPYGDADALRAAVTTETAAVFLEPTQGEAGVVAPPAGYLAVAREVCDKHGALFVLDEVQSGIGRTGVWFAHEREGIRPDVMTIAKGLGGGLPIAATVGFGPAATLFRKGDHGSTFGGNPVACAAALAVIETIERDGLLAHTTQVGERLAAGVPDHRLVHKVRGHGLWRALVVADGAAPHIERAARDAGFLTNAVSADAVRLAPPLVISAAEVDEFTQALPGILDAATEAVDVASGVARVTA